MDYITSIDIEFPGVMKDGKFYTLDLSKEINTWTYKKCFIEEPLGHDLEYMQTPKGCCFAEGWFIRNNPNYDYLHKKEEPLTL